MENWSDLLTQQQIIAFPHQLFKFSIARPASLSVSFCIKFFLQQWTVGSGLATVLENDSTPRFRGTVAGTTFLFYPLLSLSVIIEKSCLLCSCWEPLCNGKALNPWKILFNLQKLCPCKFGLVMNLSILVPDPVFCFPYAASVSGVFAKIWHKQEP